LSSSARLKPAPASAFASPAKRADAVGYPGHQNSLLDLPPPEQGTQHPESSGVAAHSASQSEACVFWFSVLDLVGVDLDRYE
jgi:hypothetical protein